ncbi:protein phosphatase CheZ [bacterium]|nr:protein phosphatase CheZ [bacterium]
MEKAEITRLINSFNAIKGYFDTTKKYMPQIAKLVYFIEEVVPLLNSIHSDLHQSSEMIPSASEKLSKVTSATEMATTEVMDKVDNVINRLNTMTTALDEIETLYAAESCNPDVMKEKTAVIRGEVEGSQDDLFSIMNALQFQDITTQQINSIAQVMGRVQNKLGDLLQGFDEEGIRRLKETGAAFDSNAEFDFDRSAKSQRIADEYLEKAQMIKTTQNIDDTESADQPGDTGGTADMKDEIVYGADGQPDINALLNKLNESDKNKDA